MPSTLYGGASDADLQQILAQLSTGPTKQELAANGLSMPDDGGGGPANLAWGSPTMVSSFYHTDFKGGGKSSGREGLYDRIAMASPSAAIYHGMRKSAAAKRAKAKARAARAAHDAAVADFMKQRGAALETAKRELQARNTKNQINGYFKSDKMEGLYDSLRSNVLQNSLADIVNKYDSQLKQSAFQTADQGLTGSSVDAERRGDVAQAANTDTIKAAGSADSYVRNVRDQNDQQRRSLVDTLSSDNPGDAAQLESQTRGIANNTQNLTDQYGQNAANAQINQSGFNMQSQAFGNLLSNYANLYSTGQQAQGYGGNGNAF